MGSSYKFEILSVPFYSLWNDISDTNPLNFFEKGRRYILAFKFLNFFKFGVEVNLLWRYFAKMARTCINISWSIFSAYD